MSDPFQTSHTSPQLIREARAGLIVIVGLVLFFGYVGYYRISDYNSRIPDHIRNAPVATHVGADFYARTLGNAKSTPDQVNLDNGLAVQQPPVDSRTRPNFRASESKSAIASLETLSNTPNHSLADNPIRQVGGTEPIPSSPTARTGPRSLQRATENISSTIEQTSNSISGMLNLLPGAARPEASTPDSNPKQIPSIPATDQFVPSTSTSNVKQSVYDIVRDPVVQAKSKPLQTESKTTDFRPIAIDSPMSHDTQPNSFLPLEPTMTAPVPGPSNVSTKTETRFPIQHPEPIQPEPNTRSIIPQHNDRPLVSNSQTQPPVEAQLPGTHPVGSTPISFPPVSDAAPKTEPEPRQHRITKGESYWSVAQQYYEDGRLFRALFLYNRPRLVEFENLKTGTMVDVPPLVVLASQFSEECPADLLAALKTERTPPLESDSGAQPGTYITRSGDTLFDIARTNLGQASRYLDVLKSNRSLLPSNINHLSKLPEGIKLVIPR